MTTSPVFPTDYGDLCKLLCSAISEGNRDLVLAYLANTKPKHDVCCRLLGVAAHNGDEDLVRQLADIEPSRGQWDFSWAVHCAARQGHNGIIRLLLSRNGLRTDGEMALLEAVEHGHEETVRLLAPACDARLNKSRALQKAVESNQAGMVAILLPFSDASVLHSWPARHAIMMGYMDILNLVRPVSDLGEACRHEAKGSHWEFVEDICSFMTVHELKNILDELPQDAPLPQARGRLLAAQEYAVLDACTETRLPSPKSRLRL